MTQTGIAIGVAVAAIVAPVSAATEAPQLNLSYQRFQLENGLTVIVHEDHSAPLVSVVIYYHVGSKNEPTGRWGFAHLFEHLMFNGSEHFDGEWPSELEAMGATAGGGGTHYDHTSYFQTIPAPALDRVLWMESDRMGHLLGAIDQPALNEQRGVVQNERGMNINSPYGRAGYHVQEGLFPPEHPYHHATAGSTADLDAASLDDVKQWFQSYYGPNNAVLVLAGDISLADARAKVERYFGDIPAGPTVDAWSDRIPVREHNTREFLYDTVPAVRSKRVWALPAFRSRDRALLDIAAQVLAGGSSSRFNLELVNDRQVATGVSIETESLEIASTFGIVVSLRPGQDVSVATEAIDRIVAQFLASGPTREELQRAVAGMNVQTVREHESQLEVAHTLATGELYATDPAFLQTYLTWINNATPEEVRDASRRFLSHGSHQVDVLPRPTRSVVASNIDRSVGPPPIPTTPPHLVLPTIEQATLSNGARLVVAHSPTMPAVEISLQFDAGFAADANGKIGVAAFAARMLNEGTRSRDTQSRRDEARRIGASINAESGWDTTWVSLFSLKDQLEPAIELWADAVMNAAFSPDAVERVRQQLILETQAERSRAEGVAQQILASALGDNSTYARLTGSGPEATMRAITRDDLIRFRDTWLRPDNSTIFVVGDTHLAEVQPILERALRAWRSPTAPLPHKAADTPQRLTHPRVIIVDRPGARQSVIVGTLLGPPSNASNDLALDAMNDAFGYAFSSRLNMNLREGKHWAYYAIAQLRDTRGPRPYLIRTSVQSDRTGDALGELVRELVDVNGTRPITQAEMDQVIAANVRELPGALQSQAAVLRALTSAVNQGRPLDYVTTLPRGYEALTLADLRGAARELLRPNEMVWVIVGDRSQIAAQIAALNIAPIEYFTADGARIE